jgi:HNH endonuclease
MSEKRVTTQLKKSVVKRANGCCEYCRSQESFAIQAFAAEHIIPKSQGGETNLDNLPNDVIDRVLEKIQNLALEPCPDGVVKLKGFVLICVSDTVHLTKYESRISPYRTCY